MMPGVVDILDSRASVDSSAPGAPTARTALGAVVLARLKRVRAADVYLVIALVWGVTMCLLVPPFQQFDEVAHYQRAWAIVSGQVLTDGGSRVVLPAAVADLPSRLDFVEVGEGRAPYDTGLTRRLLSDGELGQPVEVLCFAGNPMPLGHLPAAAGVGAARLLGLSPLAALYGGRLVNLIVAALVVYLAIRILPFGRPLYVLVALLPMTVTQFAAVSPDAMTIAGVMLFFALVLRLRESPPPRTTAQGVVLVAAGALLLNVKPAYAALALLVVLIPAAAWGSRRRHWVWVGLVVGLCAGVTLVNQALAPSAAEVVAVMFPPERGVDVAAQTDLVLHHPGVFVDALRETAGTSSLGIAANLVGILGRGYVPISQVAVFLVVAAFTAVLVATRDLPGLTWTGRGLVLALCGASAAAIGLAMYVVASAVGGDTILGIQGRYFIPLLAVGVFAFQGLRRPPRWALPLIAAALAATLALASVLALVRYYY